MKTPSSKSGGKATKGSTVYPFRIDQHSWVLHEWLRNYKEEDIIRNFGVGYLALVRSSVGTDQDKEAAKSLANPITPISLWSADLHDEETRRFFESDRDLIDQLVIQGSVNRDALVCLNIKMDTILNRFEALALAGNRYAMSVITRLAFRSVQLLNSTAIDNPNLIRDISRNCYKWPVLKSLHPGLGDDSHAVLRQIQLGANLPMQIESTARWQLDAAGKIALKLLLHIWDARTENSDTRFDYGPLGPIVDKLPLLRDKQSAMEWWEVGKAILLWTYPQPETVSEFAQLVTAKSYLRSPGRIRNRILTLLQSRFIAFAPK